MIYVGSDANIFSRMYYHKDSLHPMKWTLTKEKKEILGYKCKSATTTFRGKNYIAFYAPNIPISDVPWKFGGLPGLILEIQSEDKEVEWTTSEINSKPIVKTNNLNFDKYKFLTWKQYTEDYIITFDRYIAKQKASGRKGAMKIFSEEIFYPKAQTGIGIEF